MTRVRDHQSPAEQAGNAVMDIKDVEIRSLQETVHNRETRIDELLEANNRFEQRGRMAERLTRFLESCLLDGNFGPTREHMARHLILEYRKDNPRS